MKRVLIANRGEIACRIARTLHDMNIRSIAVYSDADHGALHTTVADEAYRLGGPESVHSYLAGEKIIQLAKKVRADAIHPGYGFLSEQSRFAKLVEQAGLVYIGPSPRTIRLCGDKVSAKALAHKLRVPTVPGITLKPAAKGSTAATNASVAAIQKFAARVKYPILIKATAGGGGRGVVRVNAPNELGDALSSAARNALASFGSSDLFVERYIISARHIEVQIFGDRFGEVATLSDRDCTLQRHHQKVVEEAPAPGISEKLRTKLHRAALSIARGAHYRNAGTVEFLIDEEENFYFLEVNSRLQVEHPVTEMVLGLDLVECQLRAARGERLRTIIPREPQPHGHSIQCRLCAELPEENFRPATGTIELIDYQSSSLSPTVRIDTGYRQGDTVSHYYDSLLAKLIVHAPDREGALEKMQKLLSRYTLAGISTNHALLSRLMHSEAFQRRSHHTTTVLELLGDEDSERISLLLSAGYLFSAPAATALGDHGSKDIWSELSSFRIGARSSVTRSLLLHGSREIQVTLSPRPDGSHSISSSSLTLHLERVISVDHGCLLEYAGRRLEFRLHRLPSGDWLSGSLGTVQLQEAHPKLRKAGEASERRTPFLSSSLPGKIVSLKLGKGGRAVPGEVILVIESMKMEHPLAAPDSATVDEILISEGDLIQAGQPLVKLRYDG